VCVCVCVCVCVVLWPPLPWVRPPLTSSLPSDAVALILGVDHCFWAAHFHTKTREYRSTWWHFVINNGSSFSFFFPGWVHVLCFDWRLAKSIKTGSKFERAGWANGSWFWTWFWATGHTNIEIFCTKVTCSLLQHVCTQKFMYVHKKVRLNRTLKTDMSSRQNDADFGVHSVR